MSSRPRRELIQTGSALRAGEPMAPPPPARDRLAVLLTSVRCNVSLPVLAGAALLQIVALLARNEAWHLSIDAAGGSVARRVLYRASRMQVLGSVLNGQLGVAARMTALSQGVRGRGSRLRAAAETGAQDAAEPER
jgi:hypothetical protein